MKSVQGINWETAKTEKDLVLDADGVVVSLERLGSKIQSVTIMAQDTAVKIVNGDYGSDGLKLFKLANSSEVLTKFLVAARKDGDTIQCVRDTLEQAEDKKQDLELDGWEVKIIETEEVVEIDVISGKPNTEFEIPF